MYLLLHRFDFFATYSQSYFDFFQYQLVESAHAASQSPHATGQASLLETSYSSAYLLLHRFDFFAM